MTAFIAKTSTHTVTTTVAANNEANAPLSIRQIIMGDILAGVDKAITKAKIEQFHGGSAAAAKFPIHYGWYKSTMKKAGQLFGSGAAPVNVQAKAMLVTASFGDVVVEDVVDDIEAKAAALAAAIDAAQDAA